MDLVVAMRGCQSNRQIMVPVTRESEGTPTFPWMPAWRTGHTPGPNISMSTSEIQHAQSPGTREFCGVKVASGRLTPGRRAEKILN